MSSSTPESPFSGAGRTEVKICSAIHGRRLVGFTYDGRGRVVEPHTFGVLRDGREALCGFQVRGGSRSGAPAGWKTFYARKMRGLVALPDRFFGTRIEYRQGDRGFARILCELKAD